MIYFIFVLCILVLVSIVGLISGAETAITGVSKAYLYHLAKKGDVRAKKVIALQEKMTTTIGTILVIGQLIDQFIIVASTLFALNYLSFTSAEVAIMQTTLAIIILIYCDIFPSYWQYSQQQNMRCL